MTTRNEDLIQFAEFVLDVLSETDEWSMDDLTSIARKADKLGLATADAEGYFRKIEDVEPDVRCRYCGKPDEAGDCGCAEDGS